MTPVPNPASAHAHVPNPSHRRARTGARLLLAGAFALLSGCANYQAASTFAAQTGALTSVVRTEMTQLDALCTWQGELEIVTANRNDEAPLDTCRQYQAAQGRLADATLAVLDGYATALAGVADDRAFDLAPDLEGIGAKVQGLTDRNGQPLVSAQEVGALTKLAELLVHIATEKRRQQAVEEMVRQVPNLRTSGQLLKSYFVASGEVPRGRAQPPYRNFAELLKQRHGQSLMLLNGPALRAAEPIRTAELRRDLRRQEPLLAARAGSAGSAGGADPAVPRSIADALDAWQQALDSFASDALKPAPKDLLDRLKVLRTKAQAARQAVEAKGP